MTLNRNGPPCAIGCDPGTDAASATSRVAIEIFFIAASLPQHPALGTVEPWNPWNLRFLTPYVRRADVPMLARAFI